MRLTSRLRGATGRRVRDARTTAREVIDAPLPQVRVLGLDETRRGRPAGNKTPTPASRA
ncbi:hypothetical protein ABT124_50545 [Streptomyces sp. NPDC001982]|uniref:hypothetical protein n=1 Tax=Streptomyces sp. NPDC001982 TaxID=3154405 RepID=UPI003328AA48